MAHGVPSTNGLAFSNNSRSFTHLGNAMASDNKSSGSSRNPIYGTASKTWDSSNIWSNGSLTNGYNSKTATRDNSRSRDTARQSLTSEAEVVEGKTGSGSLVGSSSIDDWSYRNPWVGKRSLPSGQSISQVKFPETTASQQRSVSNAGLPASFSSTTPNPTSFTSRPPAISLNSKSATQARGNFGSTYSTSFTTGGHEQPPNVYTKFDRPSDPNSKKLPDSAKGGLWTDCSLTDERKPFSMQFGSRTASTPASRDGSIPSQHTDDLPFSNKPDYSRNSFQRLTQPNSRAPSISSQENGTYNSAMNPDLLAMQLGQFSLGSDVRPFTSYKGPAGSNSMFAQSSPTSGLSRLSLASLAGATMIQDPNDSMQGLDRLNLESLGPDGYISPQATSAFPDLTQTSYGGQTSQTPTAEDFRQGQTCLNGDVPTAPRSAAHFPTALHDMLPAKARSQEVQEQSNYLDFHMQQMLASQLRAPYGTVYSPYALPNTMQLGAASPYSPFDPMNLAVMQATVGPRDTVSTTGDSMQSALMYEFKSNSKSRRYELKDIYDHIAEFSGDQHGSRFIQTKLESANSDEKERVFREIQPNAIQLMTDVFGNYVIQKFFEHGDQTHKKILANKMKGQVLNLSLQMYGCRVVQKALDHVLVDQQHQLISELEGQVLRCVKDQNGNHVIQKAIERCPPHTIYFIIHAFHGQVQHLSIHPYGCRVIQRCLERCDPPSKQRIMAELMDGIPTMISDQYGNYVVQHIVQHDEGEGRKRVLDIVNHNLESYSKHKFASNVVEKCLEKADDSWRRQVVFAIANGNQSRGEGEGVFVGMIKDSYGNYVIQKLLDTLSSDDYLHFLDLLQPAMTQAKRGGCGKQVLSIEKKMHRFGSFRGGPPNGGTFNPNLYRVPLAPFTSNIGSAATTPSPLTAESQSLQSSAMQSVNGDAVEGAPVGIRTGSEPTNEGYFR